MADTKTAYITLDNLTRYNNNIKATYETIANVALKADDNKVVHLDGAETITGVKTFSNAIVGDLTGNADTATLAETATKSVQDGDGNVIAETYLKSASISGVTDEEIDALFN